MLIRPFTETDSVLAFYRALGYDVDPIASMSKRLIPDD
jgi:hypothetical protein